MFKFSSEKFKGIVIGFCFCLIFTSVVPVIAASRRAKLDVVYDDIKLYVDGKLTVPTDPNGNKVEPFIYDGTTYLPARALSNALTNNQKDVTWDSEKSSIYIGQAPVADQIDITELKSYNSSTPKKGKDAHFQVLDETITAYNYLVPDYEYVYMLKSDYSEINGYFVVPYTKLGSTAEAYVKFYSVDKKGVETLIKEYKATAGDDIVPVSVPLKGVEILKIKGGNTSTYGRFYNVNLMGIK